MGKQFYVYIVTNDFKNVLYTGMTNNLQQRITEHYLNRFRRNTFAGRYNAYNLIYYETSSFVNNVIAREKEIKGWNRDKKVQLINGFNPDWKFLNEELFGEWPPKVAYRR